MTENHTTIFERARVEGGIELPNAFPLSNDDLFHTLWAAFFPELTAWNHAHVFDPFWRVYFNQTPGNYILFEAKRIPLTPNAFVIVPANVLFKTFSGSNSVPHFCLHFSVNSTLLLGSSKPLVLPVDPISQSLVMDLCRRLRRKVREPILCRHRCQALLHYLFSSVFQQLPRAFVRREEITKVLQRLESDPLSFSTANQMALFAGMSDRNFHRHFLGTVGRSPTQYLREVRLRQAARQLAQTDFSIESIAERLGFSNRFHFSKLFREFTGMPPASFRREKAQGRGKFDQKSGI